MKLVFAILVSAALGMWGTHRLDTGKWTTEPRMAEGEWRIELQTPPCDDVHNLQVIWPAHSGEPATIECDSMPVGEK